MDEEQIIEREWWDEDMLMERRWEEQEAKEAYLESLKLNQKNHSHE